MTRYPIYVPSKGRVDACLTAEVLNRDGVPFFLVVEPPERDAYTARYGAERVLILPFANRGSVIPARNWIKQHSKAAGAERHWQLDDNIRKFEKWHRGRRIPCEAGVALQACEEFTDRYENIGVSGLNYHMFGHQSGRQPRAPFWVNVHVYSCCLILNSLPHQWRGRYNEDTDLCLQVLADGWCTVLFNAFLCDKITTMTMTGGNTSVLYHGDGRLKMARSLERQWPGVVKTDRRWQRPQHVVKDAWKRFDTPLRLKPGIDLAALPKVNDYGMTLKQVKPIKSEALRRLVEDAETARRVE